MESKPRHEFQVIHVMWHVWNFFKRIVNNLFSKHIENSDCWYIALVAAFLKLLNRHSLRHLERLWNVSQWSYSAPWI